MTKGNLADDRKNEITFADLLAQRKWDDYREFISQAPQEYAKELSEDLSREKEIRQRIRAELLSQRFSIRQYKSNLSAAEALLFNGRVVGVDGTIVKQRTLSGLRCQIGVVAVNYNNKRVQTAYFISEASLRTTVQDLVEVLKSRETKNRILSEMVVRALMLYREREVAVRPEFANCHKLLHGPLFPFELMTGLGKMRALESTLSILEKLAEDEKVMSIISTSTQDDYLTLGAALEPGEYMVDESFSVGDEINANHDFFDESKWRAKEHARVEAFLKEVAGDILIGVIKVAQRPYVFHAHRKVFDESAAIIARDARLQHEKGFPLLIDYADTLCSNYFPASDFTSILNYRLARDGVFLENTSERDMRAK